jgi:spore maturation protein CgeB
MKLKIVILGLSITSSWGNGHATTYRALIKALNARGHAVCFLERDMPWYAAHRDLPDPDYCEVGLYGSLQELAARYGELVRGADCVVLGSYVPNGVAIGDWLTSMAGGVTAFYDIDTPVTLAGLEQDKLEYMSAALIPRFDLYLSFTGGPALAVIEDVYGGRRARPLYCSADPELHRYVDVAQRWSLGYLGTYSEDRHAPLNELLINAAERMKDRRFAIAGAKYPDADMWPSNVDWIEHVPPDQHASFYCAQRFSLNITRKDMRALGFSPSVRLFEAAACGVPLISDLWAGLDTIFAPGSEVLTVATGRDVMEILTGMDEERRLMVAANARARVLREHTPAHRAKQLEAFYLEALDQRAPAKAKAAQLVEI